MFFPRLETVHVTLPSGFVVVLELEQAIGLKIINTVSSKADVAIAGRIRVMNMMDAPLFTFKREMLPG
jgi:hypothetical protein